MIPDGLHLPLDDLEPETLQQFRAQAWPMALPAGSQVFAPGRSAQAWLLLLQGSVRVRQIDPSGRETTLYRLAAGDSCALTTACLLGSETYPAEATTETACQAVVLPAAAFEKLLGDSRAFRRRVLAELGRGMAGIVRAMGAVTSDSIDVRLARGLLTLADDKGTAWVTQVKLAEEIGAARDVACLHLNSFADRGWVLPGRGRVTILQRAPLERLAGQPV